MIPLILVSELDLDGAKMNQHVEYLGQRLFLFSGVARIWCQECQKLLGFYSRQLSTYSRCQTLYRSKCTEKNKLL